MKKNVLLLMIAINLFFITGFSSYITHSVSKGESLYSISKLYSVSVADIIGSNQLKNNNITAGQILKIPVSRTYTVQKNDSLGKISEKTGASIAAIKTANHLSGDKVIVGQTLLIPGRPLFDEKFTVRKKDTLTTLSILFDTPISEIKSVNKLTNDKIIVGQTLLFKKGLKKEESSAQMASAKIENPGADNQNSNPKKLKVHIVEKNQSLWGISQKYNVTVEAIQKENKLTGVKIIPGDKLIIPDPVKIADNGSQGNTNIQMAGFDLGKSNCFSHETGIYYNSKPFKTSQPSLTYKEMKSRNPQDCYNKAKELLNKMDAAIAKEPKISNRLKGYTFVIDPGHGGEDPGFVTTSQDGNGRTVYMIEDEYNYDTALRLYRYLKLNGARVYLTVISPNHTIRNQSDPVYTFVHETNEVFNSPKYNRAGVEADFPDGNSSSLYKRQALARNFFYGTPADKRYFISIHYDNYSALPSGLYVIFDGENQTRIDRSKDFASQITKISGGHFGNQKLAVLKNNGAFASVLCEVRNVHYKSESWQVRDPESRQRDAENIGKGIISAVIK